MVLAIAGEGGEAWAGVVGFGEPEKIGGEPGFKGDEVWWGERGEVSRKGMDWAISTRGRVSRMPSGRPVWVGLDAGGRGRTLPKLRLGSMAVAGAMNQARRWRTAWAAKRSSWVRRWAAASAGTARPRVKRASRWAVKGGVVAVGGRVCAGIGYGFGVVVVGGTGRAGAGEGCDRGWGRVT